MLLGSAQPAAATVAAVYTVPASRRAVINVNCCNIGDAPAKVRLALSADAAPQAAQWIEWDVTLDPSAVLERTGIALGAGQKLFAYSDSGQVTVNVWGVEELA